MKIIYVNCGGNSYLKVDHLIYRRNVTFAVAKRKPEKNSGLYGIRTFDNTILYVKGICLHREVTIKYRTVPTFVLEFYF